MVCFLEPLNDYSSDAGSYISTMKILAERHGNFVCFSSEVKEEDILESVKSNFQA